MPEPTWRDSLPEELKVHPALKDTVDVPALAKQFVDLQSHLGQSIRIPSKEAGVDDVKAFYTKVIEKVPGLIVRPDMEDPVAKDAFYAMVGRPVEDKGYELPDGNAVPEEVLESLRKSAWGAGINKNQFKAVTKALNESLATAKAKAEKSRTDNVAAIDKEYGAAKDSKLNLAKGIAVATGAPKELIEAVGKGEASVATVNWLLAVAAKFPAEGADIVKQGDGANASLSPSEARNRIIEIRANSAHPVWNVRDPLHDAAVNEWADLHKFMAAGQ